MLIPLRVSFTFPFNPAASHHHCPKPAHVEGEGGGGGSLCSKETKQKERHHTNPPSSRFLSQNTKIITRASKYAMFEMIFLFVVVA